MFVSGLSGETVTASLAEYSLEQGIIDLTSQQPEFQETGSGFWYTSTVVLGTTDSPGGLGLDRL